MSQSNNSSRSTVNMVVRLTVSVLVVFALAISGWAYTLSGQVRENKTVIEILKENHGEMRKEIHDIWKEVMGGKDHGKVR